MVIHDLDVVGMTLSPPETDSKLTIDADTVLPLSLTLEFLKMIRRWDPEIA